MPVQLDTTLGVVVPNLQEIILEWQADLQEEFGNPELSVEDDENLGHFVKVMANRENLVSQALQQIYAAQTRNGAENIFLDEIFSLNGVFREGATFGQGETVVATENVPDSTIILKDSSVSTSNGVSYKTNLDVLVSDRVAAFKLDASSIPLDTYNFEIVNLVKGVQTSFSVTLAVNTPAAREAFLNTLSTNLLAVNPSETNISVDVPSLTLFYGLKSDSTLVGLSEYVTFKLDKSVGVRYSVTSCTAGTKGYNPLGAGGVSSISPSPAGFLEATNIKAFFAGSEIQTDAAYTEDASIQSDSPRSSTPTAIYSGLLRNVEGVSKVIFNKVVTPEVVVTPVIIGGNDYDIAVELERTQPINNIYGGDIAVVVPTSDGETETIRFSRGTTQPINVRVTYSTDLGTKLLDTEQTTIKTNLVNFSQEWKIGDLIFNDQLKSPVFGGVPYGRFKTLKVETKKTSEPDTSYSEADYVSGSTEITTLSPDDIIFNFNSI